MMKPFYSSFLLHALSLAMNPILFEFSSSCIVSCGVPLCFKYGKNGNLKRHSTFLFTPFNHAATCDPRASCSPSTIFHMQYRVYPEGKPCIVECSFIGGSVLGVSGGAACVMTHQSDDGVLTIVSGICRTCQESYLTGTMN